MKYLILLVSLIGLNAHCQIEADKKLHFAATTTISSTVSLVSKQYGDNKSRAAFKGIVTANLIGLAKEYTDPVFDKDDIKYNIIGSVFGAFAVWTF